MSRPIQETAARLGRTHPVSLAAVRAGLNPSLIVQRARGWTKVREECRCRMCLRGAELRTLTRHHVVPLAWFRRQGASIAPLRHCDANIVPLCRPCHDLVENTMEGRRLLRKVLGAAEAGFAVCLRGRDWLDRYYPQAGGPPVGSSRPMLQSIASGSSAG